jgi:cell division protein FtsZ
MKPRPQRIVKTLDTEVKTELTKPIEEKPQPTPASIFETPKPVVDQPQEEVEDAGPAISKTVLYSEPEKEESLDTEASSQVEESEPSPSEDKPIIRHTLEDDTFGSLEESKSLVEDNSKEKESNEETFDLEPTLKNEVEEETKKEVAATEEPHFNDPLETEEQEEEMTFEVKKVESSDAEEPVSGQDNLSPEERQASIKERMARLRNLSSMLKSPSGISNLETEPAFKRRSIELDDVQSSSESKVSRYTLSESEDQDGEKRTEIKPNNSFLHDNVD